jgi:hypothetical protein
MTTKFKVDWDNGASACGTFSQVFDTYEQADAYGREWSDESNLRDFGTVDPDEAAYSYEIVEVSAECPYTDAEKEGHEGAAHFRMTRECRP